MVECFRCKVSGDEERLTDVIFHDELVKACEDCIHVAGLTVIRRPTTFQLKAAERTASVYERLSKKKNSGGIEKVENRTVKQGITLKDIIDKRMKEKLDSKIHPNSESKIPDSRKPLQLIDNFHWVIMRARRDAKITHEHLGVEIGESVAALKMAEQGRLPEDDYILIHKLENYFKIKLRKDNTDYPSYGEKILKQQEVPKKLAFDKATLKNLTLADLREMKKKREEAARVPVATNPQIQEHENDGEQAESDEFNLSDELGEEEKQDSKDKKWWQVWK